MCAFLTFYAQGNKLKADIVFSSLALFNIVRTTMGTFFPTAVERIAECMVSARRIFEFLQLPELDVHTEKITSASADAVLIFDHASFSWPVEHTKQQDPSTILEQGKLYDNVIMTWLFILSSRTTICFTRYSYDIKT
jgi:hypothetical protein